jgi:hypothetical protein
MKERVIPQGSDTLEAAMMLSVSPTPVHGPEEFGVLGKRQLGELGSQGPWGQLELSQSKEVEKMYRDTWEI